MKREEKTIVALLGISHALTHGYLLIFPAVLILLQKEFSLGYLELGIISNIMTFTYGLGALPGGMIYNRLGPKKLYFLCFLGSAGASLLVALSPNIIVFTAGLALLGALGSIYHPMGNVLITSKVQEYGRALGIHGATGNIGLALTPLIAGLIASRWGWRQAYFWFMIPGVALALWAAFIDMSVGEKPVPVNPARPPITESPVRKKNLWVFFSLPLVLIYLTNMLQSFSFHGTITFLPTYMAQHTSFQIFSWDSVAIGGMLSGISLFMGVFGQYMGGTLGQKPHLERNMLIMAALAFPFMLAMSVAQNLSLFVMAMAFFFLNFAMQPMTNVLLAQNTAVEMRGTAFGIYFFAAFGIASIASSFAGYIAERLGLPWVFVGLSFTILLLILSIYFLIRTKFHRP
jgi:MFS family permease